MIRTRRAVLATVGTAAVSGCTGRFGGDGGVDGGNGSGNGDGDGDGNSTDGGDGGSGSDGDDDGGTDSAPAVESPSLLLNWRISGLHAPYFAAQSQGFYEEEGFESVTIESGEGSDFSAQQVALGNTEFGVSSSDQVLGVNAGDLSPLAVGVVMQRSPVVVFSSRERFGEELTDPSQLSGATVGSGPGMVRQMVRGYFDAAGVTDVEYVDTGYDTVQRLLAGEIDAAGGVFGDVVDARHQGAEVDVLSVHDAVPSYGHVLTVGESFAEENPETVAAFLRATARGAVWADRNPEGAIDALVDAQGELAEVRENQRDKWDLMRSEYMLSEAVREEGWGWSEPEPWQRTYETLDAADFFDGSVDPDAVWTNEHIDTDDEHVADYADLVDQ
ncbi:ABC transporter substrate-binding protein [Halorubrum sp. Hd13]|uniref:ABC transporter substrate-binding protein n=1 Tax=Halorubrum sp. Hd13 TaxID=1480728 RepID=UPI000B9890F9|nr:ABC transporter substrate-binding protein [Halorubrum sp. Hd13]OYR38466.1 myristoyl transferase [Halorubrum sp. Hd13]